MRKVEMSQTSDKKRGTFVFVGFLCGPFLKSLLNLLQYCFFFKKIYFSFFGHQACGVIALVPGIEPTPPALEGEFLITGPPGKSLTIQFFYGPIMDESSPFLNFLMWYLSFTIPVL